MAPKQKMRLANEKHSKNVVNRGNVPKSLVSISYTDFCRSANIRQRLKSWIGP